jgi:APA family basic amino acid/polyamine antiporter
LVVTALYLLLNFVFLKIAPVAALAVSFGPSGPQNTDTGHVVAKIMFGDFGGALISGAIAILLVSSTSSMVLAGPRVIQAMGSDFPLLSIFAKTTGDGTPALAILTQAILSLVLVWFATIAQIVTTLGLLLTLFNLLAIAGVVIMRFRAPQLPRPYKVPFYPIPPLLFLAYGAFLVTYAFKNSRDNRAMLLASGVALASGLLIYFALMLYSRIQKRSLRG